MLPRSGYGSITWYDCGSIAGMKISVSLTDEDVEYIDVYARRRGIQSRSAVIREALRLLQASELGPDYAAAWDDWPEDEQDAWDATVADGLSADA